MTTSNDTVVADIGVGTRCARRRRAFLLSAVIAIIASASSGAQAPATLNFVVRFWSFSKLFADGAQQLGDERVQVGGTVNETVTYGGLVFKSPATGGSTAEGQVFSNDTGQTYWVLAEAPFGAVTRGDAIGSSAELIQFQYFVKTASDAKLRVVASDAYVEAIDANNGAPTPGECPWHRPDQGFGDCFGIMSSSVSFSLEAFSFATQQTLFATGGTAQIEGWSRRWRFHAYTNAGSTAPFWNTLAFDQDLDFEEIGTGDHALVRLARPITIDIPLASLQIGDKFYVSATVKANTFNRRQLESYLGAFFKDPQQANGLAFEFSGLEPVVTPVEKPAPLVAVAAPACATRPTAKSGKLRFSRASYLTPEATALGAAVIVSRVNGSQGAISARFTTTDGTAVAGTDYAAVDAQVLFADGEEGDRLVTIPILNDSTAGPAKTVNLTLSDVSGCGKLGQRSNAVLTILDDDQESAPPPPPPTFSVGGTVSGLAGTELVLQQADNGTEIPIAANGPFAFGTRLLTGAQYDVRIKTQPINPLQVCTVTNGTGTIAQADVTNVQVACVTPAPQGSLDPAFGSGGKVTVGLPGGAVAMALQDDGKIVLVGGMTLSRYNPDGALDTTFGTGGTVSIVFKGGIFDTADDVAIQPDGRIVVVGLTRVGAQDDFALARFNADGTPDASFGTNGTVSTDFAGSTDRAWAVLIQSDGRIVAAGHAVLPSPTGGGNDFAVARYTSSGALDTSFGTGGKVTTNIAGRTDLAFAARLQPDEKIVVAGRVADGGGDDPDVGLVRYNFDGSPDTTFGTGGIVRVDLNGNWDEASDLALQADGKIVVSVQALIGASFSFAVARFESDGHLDPSFGTLGLSTVTFSTLNDFGRAIAVQDDGKIVIVGQSSNLSNGDVALARLRTDGTLDTDFGTGGKVTADFFGAIDSGQAVAIQPDGRILVAGAAKSGASVGLALMRVLQ